MRAKTGRYSARLYFSDDLQRLDLLATAAEAARVDNAFVRVAAQQEQARTNDTVGVILLGLPTASLSGGNVAPQIADLKGRKETLHQTQIQRNCIKG